MAEWLTKASIWLVLACYAVVVWRPGLTSCVRLAWTVGLLAFAVHTLLAFAAFYGWSWSVAWQETANDAERLTGVRAGWGLWFNFAFGVAWALLTVRAWQDGAEREKGSGKGSREGSWNSWLVGTLHVFLLFMVIQGGLVFAPLPARVFTGTLLVCVAIRRLVCLRREYRDNRQVAPAKAGDTPPTAP